MKFEISPPNVAALIQTMQDVQQRAIQLSSVALAARDRVGKKPFGVAVISLAPNDPLAQFALNPAIPPEVRENLRHQLGLDQPWPLRYVRWLWTLVTTGDLGYSFASRLPVTALIDQFYAQVAARGGKRWDTSSLIDLLAND